MNTIAVARKALALAQEKGTVEMQSESRAVVATLTLLQNLKSLADGGTDQASPEIIQTLQGIDESAQALAKAISAWGQVVYPVSRSEVHVRFRDTVDFATFTAELARKTFARSLTPDPLAAFRSSPLGRWESSQFATQSDTSLVFELDAQNLSAGSFDVVCRFDSGSSGVNFHAAELLQGKTLAEAKPVDRDEFAFRLNQYDRVRNFWIDIPPLKFTRGDRFFLRISCSGPSLDLPSERRTTFGRFLWRQSWREWPIQ